MIIIMSMIIIMIQNISNRSFQLHYVILIVYQTLEYQTPLLSKPFWDHKLIGHDREPTHKTHSPSLPTNNNRSTTTEVTEPGAVHTYGPI